GQDTEEVHRFGSWFVTCATAPLALGLSGDIYVVLTEITASAMSGVFIASFTLLFLVGLRHVLPAVIRARRSRRSGRRSGRGDIGKPSEPGKPPRDAWATATDRPWMIIPAPEH